jgi:hypothetical protein
MVSFTPRPLYPQGKSPWYPLGGPQSRSGRGGAPVFCTQAPNQQTCMHVYNTRAILHRFRHLDTMVRLKAGREGTQSPSLSPERETKSPKRSPIMPRKTSPSKEQWITIPEITYYQARAGNGSARVMRWFREVHSFRVITSLKHICSSSSRLTTNRVCHFSYKVYVSQLGKWWLQMMWAILTNKLM